MTKHESVAFIPNVETEFDFVDSRRAEHERWASWFNSMYGAAEDFEAPGGLTSNYSAQINAESWLQQGFRGEASSYFTLCDAMSSDGWTQTISGEVIESSMQYLPPEVGAGKRLVLVLYRAYLAGKDGEQQLLADGRPVFIELDKALRLDDNDIILTPITQEELAA